MAGLVGGAVYVYLVRVGVVVRNDCAIVFEFSFLASGRFACFSRHAEFVRSKFHFTGTTEWLRHEW